MSEEKLPGLVIDIEGRITKLERSLQKANDAQKRAAAQMEDRARKSAQKIGATYSKVGDGAARGFGNLGNVLQGRVGYQIQQTATQLGDVATQIGSGTDAMRAFGMQAAQLLGPFGVMGALAGTAAAALIPLVSAFLNASDNAATMKDRLDALKDSTDTMASAVETAAVPVEELRLKYRDLADEIARAGGVMAGFAAARAKRDALGATHALSSEVDMPKDAAETPMLPNGLVDQQAVREAAMQRERALDALREKVGASAEQVERLQMALNRTDSSNSLQAVVQDAENLLAVIDELHGTATEEQRTFLEGWAAQVAAVMDSAKRQIEAQTAEDTRLVREYDANTQKLNQLAADRKEAEERLTAAKKAGDTEQVASMQRVIAAIDGQIAKLHELAATSKSVYEQIVSDAKSAAAEFASGAFEYLTGSTPQQFLDDSRTGEKGILHLIKQKESGGDYNAQWGGGKYSGGPKDFVNMTVRQVLAVQRDMLKHPENTANSSAVGAYQIVGSTLGGKKMDGSGGLVAKLDIDLDAQFTPQLQDRLASELLREARPGGVDQLRKVWTALDGVSRPVIESALGAEPVPVEDPEVAQRRAAAKRDEAAARDANSKAAEREAEAQRKSTLASDEAERAAQEALAAQKAGGEALVSVLMVATEGSETLAGALRQLASRILEVQLEKLVGGMGQGGGWLASFGRLLTGGGFGDPLWAAMTAAGVRGFATGGYTGDGGKHEIAGAVHKGEYVVSAEAVKRIGVPALEELHGQALRGYAGGGLVGGTGKAAKALTARPGTAATTVNISAPITVNGSAGTPEQNADLAQRLGREMEDTMRNAIQHELLRQLRPGGALSRR